MRNASRIAVLLSSLGMGVGSTLACSFHGDIRGGFSGVYPGSIVVASSIADAREKRLLPAAALPQTIFAFHRAVADLEAFRDALQNGLRSRQASPKIDFSIVLISTSLWSDFHVEGTRITAKYHVPASDAGRPVVITDAAVLSAIKDKSLSVAEAVQLGLIAVRNDGSGVVTTLVTLGSR